MPLAAIAGPDASAFVAKQVALSVSGLGKTAAFGQMFSQVFLVNSHRNGIPARLTPRARRSDASADPTHAPSATGAPILQFLREA
jgi:hypothetical protein